MKFFLQLLVPMIMGLKRLKKALPEAANSVHRPSSGDTTMASHPPACLYFFIEIAKKNNPGNDYVWNVESEGPICK